MDAFKKILVTGGVKSGKSRFALECASKFEGTKVFIATATASDDYMREKIEKHKQERGGEFMTIEEPLYLADALKKAQRQAEYVLIDCLTLWANNLLFHFRDNINLIDEQIRLFQKEVSSFKRNLCIVTNEVGLGVIPDNDLSQNYINYLGRINQETAQISDEVAIMISGIPQWVKGLTKIRLTQVE